MTDDRMTCDEALDVARIWAGRGVPAFPIAIWWDAETNGTNKHPLTAHGHHDATTDPAELDRLFNAKSPKPGQVWGVGLHPGPAGWAVVDIDVKNGAGGDDTWAALEAEHGEVNTYTATTASGGLHIWGGKDGRQVPNGDEPLGPGIDIRSDSGWAVASGTRTPWGSWAHEVSSPPWPPAPWPGWVLDRIAGTNGSGALRGRWQPLDRTSLHPADLAALEALEAAGGHDPYIGGDGAVMIVRPGKIAGGSASIGHIAPGVVKMFSSSWPPFKADRRYEADELVKPAAAAGLTLVPASSVRMDRPYWVWERRIPVGGTTLMPGRESLGKTALVCWAMARLTRGQLEGQWFGRPAYVVYIGTEDDRASVMVPRLTAAGADLDRVHFVDMPDGMTFSVGVDTAALTQSLTGRDVALVVVDPLDGHLQGVDTHRKAEVQQAVAKLALLAQAIRCGALGLAHLNKGDVRDLLQRVVGSVGFTTSVRALLGVGEHPDNPAERVCVLGKANMTDKATVPALRFRVDGATVPHPDGGPPIDTGLAVILGEELGIDPDAVIDSGTPAEKTARDEAADWLADVLSDGPMERSEVVKLARAEGITLATLNRARQPAGVEITRNRNARGRPSLWVLKDYVSPPVRRNPLR
jgi:hypothetical protein